MKTASESRVASRIALSLGLMAGGAIVIAILVGIAPFGSADSHLAAPPRLSGIERAWAEVLRDAAAAGGKIAAISSARVLASAKARVAWPAIASLDPDEARDAAKNWFLRAKAAGMGDRDAFLAVAPPAWVTLLMVYTPRDLKTLEELPDTGGPFDEAKRRISGEAPLVMASRQSLRALFDAYLAFVEAEVPDVPPRAPIDEGDYWLQSEAAMAVSHPNALDAFFNWVHEEGGAERGPSISSATGGLVIARADDWKGGPGVENYESGGLSPRAGNGVLVFEPRSGRVFLYFHLHSVLVRTGDLVVPGQRLGYGGDTGANAKLEGHGEHVHLEIFDLDDESELDAWAIRKLLFGR